MIVTRDTYNEVVTNIGKRPGYYGLDTETTGLRHHDKLFSIIISDSKQSWYFNFNQQEDNEGTKIREEYILDREWFQFLAIQKITGSFIMLSSTCVCWLKKIYLYQVLCIVRKPWKD